MKKQEFEELEKALIERGYKIYDQQWHHEDYVIGKGFHKEDNQWEENRNAYQILLSVYDYSLHEEWSRGLPQDVKEKVGIEIHVDVSRTVDESKEYRTFWSDGITIEKVEEIAESFYNCVCKECPEPT